jgi:hypothetical protein
MIRRVLTIDGGGIKGIFPLAFLATVEDRLGVAVNEYFDLIAGTSVGGIIALGLGFGYSATALLEVYRRNALDIFPHRNGGFRPQSLIRAKYSALPLQLALKNLFGDRTLADSHRRLVITSFNLSTERIHVFRTAHHPSLPDDDAFSAIEVGMAAVAAPTYFPVYVATDGQPYVDGCLWARNPVGMAAIEAIDGLGWMRGQTKFLSLGCTSSHLGDSWMRHPSLGASYWSRHIADLFMKSQSSAAIATAEAIAEAKNVFRINPDMTNQHFTMDGIEHAASLERIGRAEGQHMFPSLNDHFFHAPAAPFRRRASNEHQLIFAEGVEIGDRESPSIR